MTKCVWVSDAIMDPRQMRPLTNDVGEVDVNRASEMQERNNAGAPLQSNCFPANIWPTADAKSSWERAPDFFYAFGYWVISGDCAAVLRRFDLGQGALYPVNVLKKDRKTPVEGEYFCLNFGNVKDSFLPENSPSTRDWPNGQRALPMIHKDFDVAVSTAALCGPDIWIESCVNRAFFLSGALGDALKAAKLSRWFCLKKCRVNEGAAL